MKIAIIGAGISGLTCAYLLNKKHQVTLFEKNNYLGGHAHTVSAQNAGKDYLIDTGFLVYNEPAYPGFTKLLKDLQVKTIPSEMSFSVRKKDEDFEYNGHSLSSLFAQKRNIFNPRFYSMLSDILKFNRRVKSLIREKTTLSLEEFIQQENFGIYFIEYYLKPMLASIWSMNPQDTFAFPLLFLGIFFNNHGLLNIYQRPQWRTISGGSKAYVHAIMNDFSGTLIQKAVFKITHERGSYELTDQEGNTLIFDAVIIATHSDQALAIYPDMPLPLAQALKKIPYQSNQVILHTDESLMPKRKSAWASWNYLISNTDDQHPTLTYYINRLQSIDSPCSFLVSLNQKEQIDPDKILARFDYAHPIFTQETLASQKVIQGLNGTANLYFCGAYLGNGFHEDGLQSALSVCRQLVGSDVFKTNPLGVGHSGEIKP
jgi:predicted NAD/FAD-binding protein